ncbi:invasion associated locus B family protein [uncultured Roseobacter sp.]|uniref:invasion associated locus B family protein n=1 Tax=uncultured Roseobacter sp. TaxID=114847 RepID=UPI00260BA162|nr:invasion associated locus B family protein [uncultured Roseobacter sp.]
MRILQKWMAGISALALAGMTTQALAQAESSNLVAEKTDWAVYEDSDPKECWAVSVPTQSVITVDGRVEDRSRGDVLLMVFYRPDAGANAQVTFTGGYPFADSSNVRVAISGSTYEMFVDGEWAWPADTSADAQIVTAMRRGAQAVVTGQSSRGATTTDTFSLLGFTAALEEAQTRCAS